MKYALFSILHGKTTATFPLAASLYEHAFSTTFHSCRMILIISRHLPEEHQAGNNSAVTSPVLLQRTRCISKQSVHTTGGNNNRIPGNSTVSLTVFIPDYAATTNIVTDEVLGKNDG